MMRGWLGTSSADDPELYKQRLEAKLAPHRIRSTLAFAGLYQLTHELIKRSVLEQTKGFFGKSLLDDTWFYGEADYRKSVLDMVPGKPFRGSLLWLVDMNAISRAQADRLDAIYDHRHELTHELAKYIVDVDFEPDTDLFLDALTILRDVTRFWTQVEKDVGTFDEYGDIDLDEVTPLSIALLGMCINAYGEGLGDGSAPNGEAGEAPSRSRSVVRQPARCGAGGGGSMPEVF
jgi:hypothetical protein